MLRRLKRRQAELLKVVEKPELLLHNNFSEQDIRKFVTKRKISGSTRSESRRRCRDTFLSLKKTCRNLGFSFWEYLTDRLGGKLDSDLRRTYCPESSFKPGELTDAVSVSLTWLFVASPPRLCWEGSNNIKSGLTCAINTMFCNSTKRRYGAH